MTDLYDQRIDAMKASEACEGMIEIWTSDHWRRREADARNTERLAAYKRKRAAWALEGPLS